MDKNGQTKDQIVELGPASVVSWPSQLKGVPGRKMTIQLSGEGDKIPVLIPRPMDFWMSSTGTYLATYNKDSQKAKVHDKKSGKKFPGPVAARRKALRGILYRNTAEKPRIFVCQETAEGAYILLKSRIAR